MNENQIVWIKKPLFNYKDSISGCEFSLNNETGLVINGFEKLSTTRLSFQIYDPKLPGAKLTSKNSIKIDLEPYQVQKIYEDMKKTEEYDPTWKSAFSVGTTISITKRLFKNQKKDLIFKFLIINNSPVCNLTITDNLGDIQKVSINLDGCTFRFIYSYLTNYLNNIAVIDATLTQAIYTAKLSNDINNLSINNIVNNIVHEEIKETCEPSDMQKDFQEKIKNYKEIDIGQEEIKKTFAETNGFTQNEKTHQPFINNFLNRKVTKLKEWSSAFINLNEKADVSLYCPWDMILGISMVPQELCNEIQEQKNYYYSQFFILNFIKRKILEDLINKNNSAITKVPSIKFNEVIKPDTLLYKVALEITVTFLTYSILTKQVLNWIETNNQKDNISIEEYNRSHFIMKTIFSPFIFSLDYSDENKMIEDIMTTFNFCVSGGFMEGIAKEYSIITQGLNLTITPEMFEQYCNNFITNVIKANNCTKIKDIDNLFHEYNMIDIPHSPIASPLDIFQNMNREDKHNKEEIKFEEKEEEQIINEEVKEDEKLKLFMECAKQFVEKELLSELEKLNSYENLVSFFKKNDIPDELFKIKRALDINNDYNNKNEVLRFAKLLQEDQDVTESVTLQEEFQPELSDSEVNIADILKMD